MSQANHTTPHEGLGRLERAARSTGRRLKLRRALTACVELFSDFADPYYAGHALRLMAGAYPNRYRI